MLRPKIFFSYWNTHLREIPVQKKIQKETCLTWFFKTWTISELIVKIMGSRMSDFFYMCHHICFHFLFLFFYGDELAGRAAQGPHIPDPRYNFVSLPQWPHPIKYPHVIPGLPCLIEHLSHLYTKVHFHPHALPRFTNPWPPKCLNPLKKKWMVSC